MKLFVANKLMPGDIVHVQGTALVSRAIRRAVGSWGNHDALVVTVDGWPMIADAEPPRARLTELAEYEERMAQGRITGIEVYRPAPHLWSAEHGALAAAWWMENVRGRPYDVHAICRLLLKAAVGDIFPWPVGWNWAWYCTEGVRDAWRMGAGIDLYLKNNPTPRTTEKRVEARWLESVTELVMFEPGRTRADTDGHIPTRTMPVFGEWNPRRT